MHDERDKETGCLVGYGSHDYCVRNTNRNNILSCVNCGDDKPAGNDLTCPCCEGAINIHEIFEDVVGLLTICDCVDGIILKPDSAEYEVCPRCHGKRIVVRE